VRTKQPLCDRDDALSRIRHEVDELGHCVFILEKTI
jgi:hypothetical protein